MHGLDKQEIARCARVSHGKGQKSMLRDLMAVTMGQERVEAKGIQGSFLFPFEMKAKVRKGVWAGYYRSPTYKKQGCWAKQTLEASKGEEWAAFLRFLCPPHPRHCCE